MLGVRMFATEAWCSDTFLSQWHWDFSVVMLVVEVVQLYTGEDVNWTR